jgi:cobalt-zinc-cadmium efflux system outer membrane protein
MPYRRHYIFCCGLALASGLAAFPARALDLQTAIGRALASDPRLPAGDLEVEAARGGVVQAGKRPNPEASVEFENFGGSGEFSGFGSSEVTLGVQQKFERGGKRAARVEAALGKEDVANAEIAILRREIIAQTKIDFVKALSAIATVETMTRTVKRLESLVPQLEQRVAAGGSLKADLARGKLAAGRARVALEKARIDLKSAKSQLVANWSGSLGDAATLSGKLRHNGHKAMAVAELLPLLNRHPAIRSWDAVYAERSGDVSVQSSLAVPDVTLGAGVRRFSDTDDTAFVITGAIPLPVHDRNEGNIASSHARLEKVRFEREAAMRALKRRLIEAHGEMEAECAESQRLYEVVVPQGQTAASDVQSSFDQGRLTVKDLLDGYGAQLEVETLQIEADTRCHTAAAKVETLVARKPWQTGWEPVSEGSGE